MWFKMISVVTKFDDYEMSSRICEKEKSVDIVEF
jgi:hypothetical protein